jgi:hypothetical protein
VSRPRLLLHAGLHKTGTTAIQAFAAGNRAALESRGARYPTFEPVGPANNESHNRLAHSIARTGKSGSFDDKQVRRLLEHWRAQCADARLVVSAEALSRHIDPAGGADWKAQRLAYLERVADVLADFDVEVVVVLRRQAEFVHSAYLENIMKASRRGSWSFARFRDYLAERHLRYEDNLDVFSQAFGDVRVLVYDDLLQSGAFCAAFFEAFGFRVEGLKEPGRIRRSLSARQARIKRALLPVIFTRGQNRRINTFLRKPGITRLADRVLDDRGIGLWESVAARDEWQCRYDDENERIRARFRPERASLFPVDREAGT